MAAADLQLIKKDLYCTGVLSLQMKMTCAGIFKQSMGARNRLGIELSYRTARLHRLAELIPWNRFLGSLKVEKFGL
jgi:hypothetical protein